jgi:hypothetical protein
MNFSARYLLLALVVVVFRCFGQKTATAPQPPALTQPAASSTATVEMPGDPAALLELAKKQNGLRNVGSAPWHIKASYEVLDYGVAVETGSIEEFWVSEKKLKITYAGRGFNQTLYSTDAGGFRVGDQSWPSGAVLAARNSLFPFFPSYELLKNSKVDLTDRPVGQSVLKCVTVDTSSQATAGNSEVYCFDPNAPILRLFEMSRGASQSVYNGIVSFRGIYVARNILVSTQGKPWVRVHLDVIEALSKIDESSFIPPPGAVAVTGGKVDIDPVIMAGRIIYKVIPEYPETAKSIRTQGVVVLNAVIGKDGRIRDLRPISGPSVLIPSSLKAVNQWVYEPYLLDGEPVEVGTTIHVVFNLGGGGFSPPK